MQRGKEMSFLFLPDFSQKRTPGHSEGRGEAALPQRSSVDWREWPQEGSDQASGFSTQSQCHQGLACPRIRDGYQNMVMGSWFWKSNLVGVLIKTLSSCNKNPIQSGPRKK